MAINQGSYIQEEDIKSGAYPYSERLFAQGYTYDPSTGWVAPQAAPSAPSVWGAPTAGGGAGAPDFSGYPQYGGAGATTKRTPTGVGTISGGGGGTQYRPPIGSTQVSTTTFAGERPTLALPQRNEARVKALTRKALAPRLRNLRTALNRALVKGYENPNVRKLIVREALQGYGQGVEEARYGAERTAEAQEKEERATGIQEALSNYQGAMQAFLASGKRTTTTKQQYAGTTGTGESRYTTGRVGYGAGLYGVYEKPTIWDKPPDEVFGT